MHFIFSRDPALITMLCTVRTYFSFNPNNPVRQVTEILNDSPRVTELVSNAIKLQIQEVLDLHHHLMHPVSYEKWIWISHGLYEPCKTNTKQWPWNIPQNISLSHNPTIDTKLRSRTVFGKSSTLMQKFGFVKKNGGVGQGGGAGVHFRIGITDPLVTMSFWLSNSR